MLGFCSLARGAGTEKQGLSVGLRATMNRTASLAVPVAMGAIVSATSLSIGFFITGGTILIVTGLMGIVLLQILKSSKI